MATNIQAQGTGSELGCRITIDGVVKVERSSQARTPMCSVWTSPDEPQPLRTPARVPNLVRKLAIPIAIFWLALAASTNALVPPLEEVGRVHNVAQSPRTHRR